MKWTSVEQIKPLISDFFSNTPKEDWTITWLALALDTSRTTLIDYEHRWEDGKIDTEFTNTIKKSKRNGRAFLWDWPKEERQYRNYICSQKLWLER